MGEVQEMSNGDRNAQYKKEHYRQILLRVKKDYYSDELEPAAEKAGEPVGVYIKNAVKMRMEKDGFVPPQKSETPEPESDSGIAGLL